MFTLLIVFITAVCAGLAFWFYSKRQVSSLSEQLEDKNAVINAFRNHVETETVVESNHSRNLNEEWRGNVNLTPTVEEALQTSKPKKKKQKTQSASTQKTGQKSNQKQQKYSEKKGNQKPRKFVV